MKSKLMNAALFAVATVFVVNCSPMPEEADPVGQIARSLTDSVRDTAGGATATTTSTTGTTTTSTTGTTTTSTTGTIAATETTLQCKEVEEELRVTKAALDRAKNTLGQLKVAAPGGGGTALKCYCCPSMSPADGNCNPTPCELKCVFGIRAECDDSDVLIQIDGEFKCATSGSN